MTKHLLFFDGECPLCHRSVRFVLRADAKKAFLFAPLAGKTADKELAELRQKLTSLDTLVLIQNYQTTHQKILIEGRGAFRVLWLLGGKYRLLGWLSFLPSCLFDLCYRFVAKRRYKLFKEKCPLSEQELAGRLLP